MNVPRRRLLRTPLSLLAAALAFVAGCAATNPIPAPVTGGKPRLVVVIVVDGLPQRQVVDYRDQLSPDGLERFFARGAWFSDAHFGHGHTATAPGHATLLTGASPQRTGIIGNEWLDPATGEMQYCTADASATYIGAHKASRLDGTSPKNLKVESLGDVLKRTDARAKVIAVAGKDRGAILPAGKAGVAYMYQAQTGEFSSTTYYMKEHPQWVTDFNARKPADEYFHKEWRALLPESAYARSVPDAQKWFSKSAKLPMKMGEGQDKPGPLYYGALIPTPFGDDLAFNFARAAIAGERLGRDDAPDILVLSLSAHDYINHAYSAESRISHDHVLQLDLLLQSFLLDVDAAVGRDNYVAVLTSDHGFTPAPEVSRSLGRDAGRLSMRGAIAKVNTELSRRHGEGKWIHGFSADSVVFNRKLAAERNVDVAKLAEEVRPLFLAEPGVAVVHTRAELESGSRKGEPLFDQMRRSWNREVSGDLQVGLKPFWIISSGSGSAATHGSPQAHDTHVPLLIYGPPWVIPGRIDKRVDMVDLAPTLARILGIPAPAACEGKPLPLEVPGR